MFIHQSCGSSNSRWLKGERLRRQREEHTGPTQVSPALHGEWKSAIISTTCNSGTTHKLESKSLIMPCPKETLVPKLQRQPWPTGGLLGLRLPNMTQDLAKMKTQTPKGNYLPLHLGLKKKADHLDMLLGREVGVSL